MAKFSRERNATAKTRAEFRGGVTLDALNRPGTR
jgi:hypothetical protein